MASVQNETIWGYLDRLSEAEKPNQVLTEPRRLINVVGLSRIPTCLRSTSTLQDLEKDYVTKRFEIKLDKSMIRGIVIYPIEHSDDKCIVYNNPGTFTIDQFMDPHSPPFKIFEFSNSPIVLYDYRGTGTSRVEKSTVFEPTADSVAQDGYLVLKHTMTLFKTAEVWGSSLGGAVATLACAKYLNKNPNQAGQLTLYNHDSFTVNELDAEASMRTLAKKGVKIIILWHAIDPIIKKDKKMATLAEELQGVTLIKSEKPGHGNLSKDMLEELL